MKTLRTLPALCLLPVLGSAASEPPKYPPLAQYLMSPEAEIALAKSAAPASVSERATLKVLTPDGYKVVAKGSNGFVCLVLRGWGAAMYTPAESRKLAYDASLRAPICFNPVAARSVLPYQELRAKLAIAGKHPDGIAEAVQAIYAKGELPAVDTVGFAYMFSADQSLGPAGAGHPHLMVYAPYYTNAMLGHFDDDQRLPIVQEDEGTPFAVTVIPVQGSLARKASVSSKEAATH